MRRAAVLWFLLASWGCNGGDESPSASRLWCDALCSAAHRCDGTVDAFSCSSRCETGQPRLANISVEGAGPLAACLRAMKCSDVFSEGEQWTAAYGACWDRAKSVVEVTPDVRVFCEAYTLAEFGCRYWYATDACERDFGMWSDSVRSRVATCAANPACSETEACVSAIFDSQRSSCVFSWFCSRWAAAAVMVMTTVPSANRYFTPFRAANRSIRR